MQQLFGYGASWGIMIFDGALWGINGALWGIKILMGRDGASKILMERDGASKILMGRYGVS